MTPRCQPSPATTRIERAPTSGSVCDDLLRRRQDLGFFLLPLDVLAIELQRQLPHLLGQRLVVGEQQARRDVRRAHAAGGVDARREHEADVIAVDRLAGQAADVEQRAQADLVRPAGQQIEAELGDDAVLADQRHDVGERADRRDLDEAGQQLVAAGAAAERLHQLQRDADAGEILVRIGAVGRFGLITASAGGSSVSGS